MLHIAHAADEAGVVVSRGNVRSVFSWVLEPAATASRKGPTPKAWTSMEILHGHGKRPGAATQRVGSAEENVESGIPKRERIQATG